MLVKYRHRQDFCLQELKQGVLKLSVFFISHHYQGKAAYITEIIPVLGKERVLPRKAGGFVPLCERGGSREAVYEQT